jgi:serine/threonine protein kinase
MAPELMVYEHPEFSPAVDVWGLGACLYMFVTGEVPFKAPNVLDLQKLVNRGPVFPKHLKLDPHLVNLIRRMLQKKPSKRITLAEVMHHDWVTREGSEPLPITKKLRELPGLGR